MLSLLILSIVLVVLGLVVGAGVLVYQESTVFQQLLKTRPVLGWLAIVVVGGFVTYFAIYVVVYSLAFVLSLLLGHGNGMNVGSAG